MRDYQRKRLYDAENSVRAGVAHGKDLPTVPIMQAYVDDLCGQSWFIARWGVQYIEVRDGGGFKNATAYQGLRSVLYMPKWSRFELVLLHEISHCLASHGTHHGPEFAAIFRFLVGERIGVEARKVLGDAFFDYNVDLDLRAVPKPDVERVRVVRRRATVAAAKARAENTRPATDGELRAAADTIRRAVKAGTFGGAGTKPRTRALETARFLVG